MVTTQRLRQLFDYLPSGQLVRRVALSKSSKVGEAIGWTTSLGYRCASVDNKTYPLHRLVWIWHGREYLTEPDHINRNRADNRIENLRAATRSQNMWNIGIAKNNTSGVKGVIWKKDKQKWRVRIGVHGRRLHIGDFKDLELAELVSVEARAKYHGSFANHV